MKRLSLAVTFVFAASGAAFAQGPTAADQVRGLITSVVEDNETLVGQIEVREVKEGYGADFKFDLDPEKTYIVYGVCDADCSDIDLVAEDINGDEIDRDDHSDANPMLFILPGDAGDILTIRADMGSCDAETCVMGVALYEQGS